MEVRERVWFGAVDDVAGDGVETVVRYLHPQMAHLITPGRLMYVHSKQCVLGDDAARDVEDVLNEALQIVQIVALIALWNVHA